MKKRISWTPLLSVLAMASVVACSAGQGEELDDSAGGGSSVGGEPAAAAEVPVVEGTGGTTPAEADEVPAHPLLGAGNASGVDLSDPCAIAQIWEESTNMDMSTGALILKDNVVYEVTGEGKGTSVWADTWTAPPCSDETNGHCADLLYEEVATCTE